MSRSRLSLWCTEGGSDKTYTLWVEKDAKGYWLKYLYGPRGGTQNQGTKNKVAFTEEKAEKEYDKILKEKLAKGYKPLGEDVPEYLEVKEAKDAGIRPMLLTPDTEENLDEYVKGTVWCAQEKFNGIRFLTRCGDGKAVGVNRRGLERPIPKRLAEALSKQKGSLVMDGELIGEKYHAFDLLELQGGDLRDEPYEDRYGALQSAVECLKTDVVQVVPTVVGEAGKRKLVKELQNGRKEGVVFKRVDSVYEPGRRENLKKALAVKVKFYAEVAAYVLDWTDKSSIEVGLRDGAKIIPVGKVTVAAKYVDQIKKDSIVRVKYLYATAAKQLYQAHLDPTEDGSVIADHDKPDKITALKFEGKEEE